MEQIQEELRRSQHQILQLEGEIEQMLEYFQSRLYQTQGTLAQTQTQLHQTRDELAGTQEELAQTKAQLWRSQMELERWKFLQVLEAEVDDLRPKAYRELVWCGWYAYHRGDRSQMVRYLQQSLRYTPFSRTKTVSDWLKSLAEFAAQKGDGLDVQELASSLEWKRLVRRLVMVKPMRRSA